MTILTGGIVLRNIKNLTAIAIILTMISTGHTRAKQSHVIKAMTLASVQMSVLVIVARKTEIINTTILLCFLKTNQTNSKKQLISL